VKTSRFVEKFWSRHNKISLFISPLELRVRRSDCLSKKIRH